MLAVAAFFFASLLVAKFHPKPSSRENKSHNRCCVGASINNLNAKLKINVKPDYETILSCLFLLISFFHTDYDYVTSPGTINSGRSTIKSNIQKYTTAFTEPLL